MLKFSPYVFWALTALSLSQPALSEIRFPELPSKNKPLSVYLQTEYFRTNANYTNFGQYVDLPNNNSFQYIALHPRLSYSPLPYYINFKLFANSFYASSKTTGEERSVFRPTVLGGGFQVYHKIKTFYGGFELRGGAPLYKNFFEQPNEIILGDGSYFVEPGIWLLVSPSEKFYVYFNTAFRYRFSASLSGRLFNRLGGVLKTQHIDAGLAANSFISLPTNSQERQIDRVNNILKTVNGASYTFYSIKPSVLSWAAWLKLKYQPVFATLYFNLDTLGSNYAKGFSFGLITKLQWHTKLSIIHRKRRMDFDFEDRDATSEDSPYFKEEEDPYNKEKLNKELKQELRFLKR